MTKARCSTECAEDFKRVKGEKVALAIAAASMAPRLNRPATCRGLAALMDMLDLIGTTAEGDAAVAKALVAAELDLGELVKFTLAKLAEERA